MFDCDCCVDIEVHSLVPRWKRKLQDKCLELPTTPCDVGSFDNSGGKPSKVFVVQIYFMPPLSSSRPLPLLTLKRSHLRMGKYLENG
mmetsp:Transcript_16037/g.34670  ORF Transcript_16037/g.34670 Transcript_16037/m.34670 type:complete len:87 (+) Transcript_16037:3302-3562(+)